MQKSSRSVVITQPPQVDAAAQRQELTNQLTSLTIRRDLLSQQLNRADGQAAADLRAQLGVIDQRVKQTTSDLDRIDQATHKAITAGTDYGAGSLNGPLAGDLSRMIQDAVGSATAGIGRSSTTVTRVDNLQRLVIGLGALNGIGIVLMLVLLWRSMRWSRPSRAPQAETDRLEHLQRAVDVIAVEVERISEAQRFAAKLATANPVREANAGPGPSR